MPIISPPFRVALVGNPTADNSYGVHRGVIDFKEHAEHWELVPGPRGLVHRLSELDFDAVDGLVGYLLGPQRIAEILERGLPAVQLSTSVADMRLARVGNDDEAIGRMGAEYLLERGFSHFGFVGQDGSWYSTRRLRGFKEVIEEATGRTFATLLIDERQSKESNGLEAWLRDLPKSIAIMACNDGAARPVIDQAKQLGFAVPDEVAVLGVDNDPWLTQMATTPMSSVQPDWRQIGYRGAKVLDGLLAGEGPPPPQWVRPIDVVTRRSTDVTQAGDAMVTKALHYIRDHAVEGITVEDVVAHVSLSRRNLEHRMKRATGQTPHVAICRARVARAKKLLIASGDTIEQISRACGYERQTRFGEVFKRFTGLTPGEYRRSHPR